MEDINYILWGCQSAQSLWNGYLNLFRLCLDHSKDCFSIIEEAFEIRVWPFCKVFFFFVIRLGRRSRIFRGVEGS